MSNLPYRRSFIGVIGAGLAGVGVFVLGSSVVDAARLLLPGPIPATVVAVVDGDTLAVRAQVWLGQEVETDVRLDGVDTPEIHGKCGREKDMAEQARRMVVDLVHDGRVRLHDVQDDKYGGRVRARVETGRGVDLGQALIQAGLGRPYRGEARQPWCGGMGSG